MELLDTFGFWMFLTFGIVCYIYLTWNFSYWRRKKVKCDKPWPIFGTQAIWKMHPIEQDAECYKKYGRVYGIYEGRNPCLHVGDPQLLKTLLVKSFHVFSDKRDVQLSKHEKIVTNFLTNMKGDVWKNIRKVVTPSFTTGKLKQMTNLVEDSATQLTNNLNIFADERQPIDVIKYYTAFVVDVTTSCLFGTKIEDLKDPKSKFLADACKAFQLPWYTVLRFFAPNMLRYVPSVFTENKFEQFVDLIKKIIRQRTERPAKTDFLQLLLLAGKRSINEERQQSVSNALLTQDVIIAQAIMILRDTTMAFTLSVLSYCLAKNPQVQERLIREIDDTFQDSDHMEQDSEMYNKVSAMTYLEMTILETLRLYPPAARIERTCTSNSCTLGDITLRKGMTITVPVHSIHRDPEFYPDPLKFDPERFTKNERAARDPYTYLPFGYGPRQCIGMRFALVTIKVVVVHLLRRFRFRPCAETHFTYNGVLTSAFGIELILEPRTDN